MTDVCEKKNNESEWRNQEIIQVCIGCVLTIDSEQRKMELGVVTTFVFVQVCDIREIKNERVDSCHRL